LNTAHVNRLGCRETSSSAPAQTFVEPKANHQPRQQLPLITCRRVGKFIMVIKFVLSLIFVLHLVFTRPQRSDHPSKYVQDNLLLQVPSFEAYSAPRNKEPHALSFCHRPVVKKAIIESAPSCSIAMALSVSPSTRSWPRGIDPRGFYSYFNSKSDLYAEVSTAFSPTPSGRVLEGVKVDLSSGDVGRKSSAPILPPAF